MRSSKSSPAALSPKLPRQAAELKDETALNRQFRVALRADGLSVTHLRETDFPGATDLIVWDGVEILGWVELKMGDEKLRPSQVEFMTERLRESSRVYVGRYSSKDGGFEFGRYLGRQVIQTLEVAHNFRTYPWRRMLTQWAKFNYL